MRNTSSLVIDSLCDRAGEESIAVSGLYCDFLAQQEQTTTNIMGAILQQLAGRGGGPRSPTKGLSKSQNGVRWKRAATCQADGDVEYRYPFATPSFHLSRRVGRVPTEILARASRVS